MHLKQPGFTYSAICTLAKNKERIEKICRQETQILFTEINLRRLVLKMIWLMADKLKQTKF